MRQRSAYPTLAERRGRCAPHTPSTDGNRSEDGTTAWKCRPLETQLKKCLIYGAMAMALTVALPAAAQSVGGWNEGLSGGAGAMNPDHNSRRDAQVRASGYQNWAQRLGLHSPFSASSWDRTMNETRARGLGGILDNTPNGQKYSNSPRDDKNPF